MLADAGIAVSVHEACSVEEMRLRARDAAQDSAVQLIVAAGGDGTVRDVAEGMIRAGAGQRPALGILPLGTTNVLARELAIPFDVDGAVRVLREGRESDLYLGTANGAVFTTMAGVGFDAAVVDAVDHRLKRLIGRGAYAASAARVLMRLEPRRYEVSIPGKGVYSAASVVVAKSLYYGGSFSCAPKARVELPELHFCLFHTPGRLNALRYALALGTGRLEGMEGYEIVTARAGVIAGTPGEPVQADGDIVTTLPLELGVTERPLRVLRPA
jgi:diacylglycerol kinase family enzyme